MNYEETKRALGIRKTAIDTGFEAELYGGVVTGNKERTYLPGQERASTKLVPPPLNLNLSHLNDKMWKHRQKLGRKGGKARAR